MNTTVMGKLRGGSLSARIMRSSLLTVGGFGAGQLIRLGSNLILTRLLFPEAFGVMALVTVFLVGLGQLSDVGVTPAILQSKRGDDPDFLNTAWTIQVFRGVLLWGVAALAAWPVAQFYGEPLLAEILPIAALTLLITGFRPTRMDTANRHLLLGRVTVIDLSVQIIGVAAAIVLAYMLQSVWALVISGLIGALAEVILNSLALPGKANRPRWERPAARELIGFGKWVFLATICGFVFSQADKLILGRLLEIGTFGIYNIGFFLAAFPMMLGGLVTRKILIPIYRETPPTESRSNYLKLRKMRFIVTLMLLAMVAVFASLGVWLVEIMYDDRYLLAGPIVVVLACAQIPMLIVMTYDQAALAAGDSRSFFVLAVARATLMVIGLLAGFEVAGFIGALIGQGLAHIAAYPVVVWLARRMGAWDGLHDSAMALLGALAAMLALALNWGAIEAFAQGAV